MKKIKINRLGIRNNISFVLLIFLLFQCSEKEPTSIIYENGIIISQPYLWRVELSENEYIGGHYDQSIVFNNNILLGAMDDQDIAILVSVESKNGEIVWESDYVRRSSSFFMVNAYQNNNLLTGRTGTVLYQLNLENGDYTWTKSIVHHGEYTWITGIDDLFYKFVLEPYPDLNYPVISAQYGNIMNGNTQLFLIPDLGDLPPPNLELVNVSIGGFRYIKPFKNETSSEIFLLCYYDKQYYLLENSAEQVSESYAGLYNFSQRQWVYEKVELGNYNFLEGFTPTIIGDRFYHTLSGGITGCHELYTGEPVWKNVDPHQYAFTGFVIAEGKMIVCDDWNENIIAFDIDNGREVWRTPTASNISIPNYLNGIVYYASGGDGRIYALDAETGEKLWRLKSPDSQRDTYDFFKKECHVFPGENGEKGRIVVSSYTHGYCYEAIR